MNVIKQQWKLFLILSIAIIWTVVFPRWSEWVTVNPLDVPISLNPAGEIERAIEIHIPDKYSFSLDFLREGHPFEKLKHLIGAMHICQANEHCSKGIPVQIRWSLKEKESGRSMVSDDVTSQDSSGWSRSVVTRHIAYIQVEPGNYVLKAKVMQDIPELESIKTKFSIRLRPKASQTWHIGLVWWGGIATYLLVWPIILFSIIKIVWHIFNPTS